MDISTFMDIFIHVIISIYVDISIHVIISIYVDISDYLSILLLYEIATFVTHFLTNCCSDHNVHSYNKQTSYLRDFGIYPMYFHHLHSKLPPRVMVKT